MDLIKFLAVWKLQHRRVIKIDQLNFVLKILRANSIILIEEISAIIRYVTRVKVTWKKNKRLPFDLHSALLWNENVWGVFRNSHDIYKGDLFIYIYKYINKSTQKVYYGHTLPHKCRFIFYSRRNVSELLDIDNYIFVL